MTHGETDTATVFLSNGQNLKMTWTILKKCPPKRLTTIKFFLIETISVTDVNSQLDDNFEILAVKLTA